MQIYPICIEIVELSFVMSAIANLIYIGKQLILILHLCFSLLLPCAILSVLCWRQLSVSLLVTFTLNIRNSRFMGKYFWTPFKAKLLLHHQIHLFLSQILLLDQLYYSKQYRRPFLACLCLKMDLIPVVYIFSTYRDMLQQLHL